MIICFFLRNSRICSVIYHMKFAWHGEKIAGFHHAYLFSHYINFTILCLLIKKRYRQCVRSLLTASCGIFKRDQFGLKIGQGEWCPASWRAVRVRLFSKDGFLRLWLFSELFQSHQSGKSGWRGERNRPASAIICSQNAKNRKADECSANQLRKTRLGHR